MRAAFAGLVATAVLLLCATAWHETSGLIAVFALAGLAVGTAPLPAPDPTPAPCPPEVR
jgi:hypothetical protein